MGKLNLALLGVPEVRHDGQVLKFPTRKALALLIYLAVEGGVQPREKLTSLFWPESEAAQSRSTLRRTLSYLRDALGEDERLEHLPHLIVERNSLGINFNSDVDLDLHTLEAAFTQIRASTAQPLKDDARQSLLSLLQSASTLYRGSFLEGFYLDDTPDFDDWARLQREVWHRRMSVIFDRLSQVQSDGGEIAGAIDTTMRWIAHDPLNEAAHQRLMQLYFADGDRKAALQAYEIFQTRLAEELHAKPAPETRAMAERIRTSMPPKKLNTGMQSAIIRAPTVLPALLEVPLVGRANEYSKLIEIYYAALRGQPHTMILKGEAGIGKTRMAREFLGWAAAQGADIISGRAFETGGRLPYQPLVEALRSRIERENAPDDLLSDTWLVELSRVLPELRDRYPDLPLTTVDETTARIRLYEAVVRLGLALAERAPLVLFLDDVQWADAATLDVLHYAGRRWAESNIPVLLLLSLRTEALISTNALTRWISDVEHNVYTNSVTLEALTLEDTVQLISSLEEREDGSENSNLEGFSRWLFAETHGQPFYIIETLKALLERKLLEFYFQGDGSKGIDFTPVAGNEPRLRGLLPSSVREVIRTRLSQLTPSAFALLTAGAILDHGFPFERLCQVAGLGIQDGLVALDEILTSRLLREASQEERLLSHSSREAYFFTHDKIRDVAYTEAGETRRRIFHERVFEALQSVSAPAAELAHHALAAELLEPAFHYCIAAGDEAMRVFAVRDAIAQYGQARKVLAGQHTNGSGNPDLPIAAIQHLYLQLGKAYEHYNEFEQAQTVYESMLAFAQELSIPTMECVSLNSLAGLVAYNRYDLERAATLLHQALHIAEQCGDTALVAETECHLAHLYMYRFESALTLKYAEHAFMLAREFSQHELIARSLNLIAYAKLERGRWEEAEVDAEEARILYRVLGNRAMETGCLSQITTARINSGRPQAAICAAQEALSISQEIGYPWGQASSAKGMAEGFLEVGTYDEALAYAEQGVDIARKSGIFILLTASLIVLGAVHRTMLNLTAAREAHLEAMALVTPMGASPLIEMMAAELCADCAMVGAWEEALSYAQQVLSVRSGTFVFSTKLTLWYETEALMRAGEIECATEDVQRFGGSIGNSRRYRIPYLRALAVLAQCRSEINEAITHLQEAAKLAEEIGLPGELWPIQAALGDLYLTQGETEQARSAFKQAAAIVRRLADNIGDDERRTAFLASPLIQDVLGHASPGG